MDRYLLELAPETRDRLERLKTYPEEPFDLVLIRLMDAYEDGGRLTREEVERIREILRDLKEGRFTAPPQVSDAPAPGVGKPPASIGDPRAIQDMEKLFSGTAEESRDPELTITDDGEIRELDPYDKRGRSRTPHLDSL